MCSRIHFSASHRTEGLLGWGSVCVWVNVWVSVCVCVYMCICVFVCVCVCVWHSTFTAVVHLLVHGQSLICSPSSRHIYCLNFDPHSLSDRILQLSGALCFM